MAVTAAGEGIRTLYHYEKFCPAHLTDTLVNQRVHVSNPQNFNDPWDCYPCLDTTQANDPKYRARWIEYIQQQVPLPDLTAGRRLSYERALQASPDLFKKMLQTSFRDAIRNMIVKRWRIYCLSPHPVMSLMWSHYSNHHRGICLEFDASQVVFRDAYQVVYREMLPALDILEMSDETAFQVLLTKSPDWSYENEYRILAHDGGDRRRCSAFPADHDQ